MAELEDRLASVLNDPGMMQQIMQMAQSLNLSPPSLESPPQEEATSLPIDPKMLQQLAGFAQQGNIDANQRTLLKALKPYLSRDRIGKLEKAMRAAKVAQIATQFQHGR